MRRPIVRFRRSPHLVAFWRNDALTCFNYATRQTVWVNPLVCRLLDFCSEWRTLSQIETALGLPPSRESASLMRRLVARSLLIRSDTPLDPREQAMARFGTWNPEAGFFHAATRDVKFLSQAAAARRAIEARKSVPPFVKRHRGRPVIDLPAPVETPLASVATFRRTWRRFSSKPVTLHELASALAITLGVQFWVETAGQRVPFKTSPSGGARHPIECYVLAQRVKGLSPGVYHYECDRHVLARLGGAVPAGRVRQYFPASGYFAKAPVIVFFTAVFDRQLWRYPYSRAYRAALVEAGHVCQTFCLMATSLGLAPFSLMGLADSAIERDLGLDGITESVLYAAGFGRPPRGTAWAPLPRGSLQVKPNKRIS